MNKLNNNTEENEVQQGLIGCECEIFIKSKNKWIHGAITKNDGQYLAIKYMNNTIKEPKQTNVGRMSLETSKHRDNLLVTGYIRCEAAKYGVIIAKDIMSLCYEWYYIEFKWNKEDQSNTLRLDKDDKRVRLDPSNITHQDIGLFHTIFLSPTIGITGKYELELLFNGPLKGKINEIALGIVNDKYSTPLISNVGIGDCDCSWSLYMNGWYTWIFHEGHEVQKLTHSLTDDANFILVIENKGNKCHIDLHYERFPEQCVSFIAPINCVKVGVSLYCNKTQGDSMILELRNFNVKEY